VVFIAGSIQVYSRNGNGDYDLHPLFDIGAIPTLLCYCTVNKLFDRCHFHKRFMTGGLLVLVENPNGRGTLYRREE
jgi:hypothetical protein